MRSILKIIFCCSALFSLQATFYPKAFFLYAQDIKQPKSEFTKAEIEELVKPIALYPDILLQQTLAASTFPEQLIDAAAFHEAGKDPQLITKQPWDASVQAMANYPSLLSKMVEKLDWTLNLASAFINQSVELREAIQTLRAKAKSVGNLQSTDKTKVSSEKSADGDTVIIIESADPQVVYVPSDNNTTIVYEEKEDDNDWLLPVASFGVGLALGYAAGDDDDDHYYYGGYYGPGFWYRDDAVNDWVDYRHDRWDDAYDFANDRQDWRQDSREDWREYQQDLGVKRQDLQKSRQENASKISPEKRAEAQSKFNSSKSDWQSKSPDQKKSALSDRRGTSGNANSGSINSARTNTAAEFDRQQASQRVSNARSNPQVQQRVNQNAQFKQNSGSYDSSRNFKSSFDSPAFSSSKSRSSYTKPSGFSGINSSGSSVNRAQSRGAYSRSTAGGGFSAGRSGGGMRAGGGGGRRR